MSSEMNLDYVIEFLEKERGRCIRWLCPEDRWMFTVAERKRQEGNLVQVESALKLIQQEKNQMSIEESLELVVSILEDCDAQQKPEIDEGYIKEKAAEIYNFGYYSTFKPKEIAEILRQIISDARGGRGEEKPDSTVIAPDFDLRTEGGKQNDKNK